MKQRSYIAFLIILTLSGCQPKEVEVILPRESHLYLNGINSSTESELILEVGTTRDILSQSVDHERPDEVHFNAKLNGNELMVYNNENSLFVKIPQKLFPEDNVEISCVAKGYPPISSVATVPTPPHISDVKGMWLNKYEDKESKVRVMFRLTADENEAISYYRIIVRSRWYDKNNVIPLESLEEKEIITLGNPLFDQPENEIIQLKENAPFAIIKTDTDMSISIEYKQQWLEDRDNMFGIEWIYQSELEVQHLSYDYFHYMQTIMASDANNAFENPVKLYSNIKGGFGLFTLYSPTLIEINMTE